MNADAATSSLLDYGSIGAMLVLSVLAIMWLANTFKKTTDEHLTRLMLLNETHVKQIEERDCKHDAHILHVITEFTNEKKDLIQRHDAERKDFILALNDNTKVLKELYCAIEKRGHLNHKRDNNDDT